MATGEFTYLIQAGGEDPTSSSMIGVFIGPGGNYLHPGPESDSGFSVVTLETHIGNLPTDIPQDFIVPSSRHCIKVQVPENASSILFGAHDAFYQDNRDQDNDFQSHIHIISMPEVEIGYTNPLQVIEAPQLSASANYYDEPYDLVANKPFAVRTGFHKLSTALDDNLLFSPVLKITKHGEDTAQTINRCTNKAGAGINTQGSISDCSFRGSNFMDTTEGESYPGVFNEVFIVEGGLEPGRYHVEVDLYPDQGDLPCNIGSTTLGFDVEVHEIQSPRIALATANCDHIGGCITPTNVRSFLESAEVRLFNTIFPVAEDFSKFFRVDFFVSNKESTIEDIKRRLRELEQGEGDPPSEELLVRGLSLALHTLQHAIYKTISGSKF